MAFGNRAVDRARLVSSLVPSSTVGGREEHKPFPARGGGPCSFLTQTHVLSDPFRPIEHSARLWGYRRLLLVAISSLVQKRKERFLNIKLSNSQGLDEELELFALACIC